MEENPWSFLVIEGQDRVNQNLKATFGFWKLLRKEKKG